MKKGVAVFFLTLVISCRVKERTATFFETAAPPTVSMNPKTAIFTPTLAKFLQKEKIVTNDFFTLIDSSYCFVFADEKHEMVLYYMNQDTLTKTSFKQFLFDNFHSSYFSNDSLYLIGYNTKIMRVLKYRKEENKFSIAYNTDLKQYFDKKETIKCTGNSLNLLVNKESVLIQMGASSGKNYISDNALKLINASKKTSLNLIKHPAEFYKKRIYYPELLFDVSDDGGKIFYSFVASDKIGKINLNTSSDSVTILKHEGCGFMDFDESKEQNLGYVRKFSISNEQNCRILSASNKRVIIFKYGPQAKITDSPLLSCYVYDYFLNPKFSFRIKDDISPFFCFNYKNGILCFASDFSKAYYYEID